MRQLIIQVPKEHGEKALQAAKENECVNTIRFETKGEREIDAFITYAPNRKVESLVGQLQNIPDLHITLTPRGYMPLHPPAGDISRQAVDIQPRSPIEIFLGGLQSIGSWKGFLSYAVAAGIVAWIGLFTNTVYLLVAAMLIAPFAGPAMNAAIAAARGDLDLLKNSLLRYFASLAVSIMVAGILSLIMMQEISTPLMVEISQISSVSVLLPIAAGAAGALNLVQSARSSLVSGAAVGMLVAASLAPPAGLVGMASVLGRWDLAESGLFVLLLQLVGIQLSGSITFRLYGLSYHGARYDRGKKGVFVICLMGTIALLAGLLAWQLIPNPNLQRSSIAERATREIRKTIDESEIAKLVEANVRFTRPQIKGQNTLLGVIYVQRSQGGNMTSEEVRSTLIKTIQERLQQKFNATPLLDLTVLDPPPGGN